MRRVFIDTGVFVAARRSEEREHGAARAVLADLVENGATLFTTNHVFAETYTTLLARAGREAAIAWGRSFRAGSTVEPVHSDEALEEAAWQILDSHEDKEWSYVDAVSFALLEREGVEEAASFDRHFAQRGLRVLPGQG